MCCVCCIVSVCIHIYYICVQRVAECLYCVAVSHKVLCDACMCLVGICVRCFCIILYIIQEDMTGMCNCVYIYTCIYICVYIYVYMCVCVCVCVH